MQDAPNREIGGTPLRYRTLLENLPGSLVFIVDENLAVVFAGGSILTKSNLPHGALAGQPLQAMMPPEAFAAAQPHLLATLAGEERGYELAFPSGETYDVRTMPLPDENGRIPHILVVAQETTAHKQAVAAERAAQQRLRQAIRAANVGLWDWDLVANRIYYSPEWKRQLGYAEDEIGDEIADTIRFFACATRTVPTAGSWRRPPSTRMPAASRCT